MGPEVVDVQRGADVIVDVPIVGLEEAIDEALGLRRFARGATASQLAEELGADVDEIDAVLARRAAA